MLVSNSLTLNFVIEWGCNGPKRNSSVLSSKWQYFAHSNPFPLSSSSPVSYFWHRASPLLFQDPKGRAYPCCWPLSPSSSSSSSIVLSFFCLRTRRQKELLSPRFSLLSSSVAWRRKWLCNPIRWNVNYRVTLRVGNVAVDRGDVVESLWKWSQFFSYLIWILQKLFHLLELAEA